MVDGSFVPSVPPALVVAGHVAGPPRLVAAFADRVAVDADGTLIARRGGATCTAAPVTAGDPPLVLLAPLARCLGARVWWDPRARTLALSFPRAAPLPTPTPPTGTPGPVPTLLPATPPPTASPRPILSGVPMPRRTAIPALPS